MSWKAAIVLALASCGGVVAAPAPSPNVAPSASEAASAPPLVTEIAPEAPRTLRGETLVSEANSARFARNLVLARGVYDAFANVTPRPVTRGFAQTQFVQFATDRKARGELAWVEAATSALHGAPDDASNHREECATQIELGEEVQLTRGRARLTRTEDHDELWVASGKESLREAKLPRGASHGACAGPDGTRVWIAWSAPQKPSELVSVSLRDGSARPLRVDARPGLGALAEIRSGTLLVEKEPGAFLEPEAPPKRAAILLAETSQPLATWDPLARFLVEAGVAVLVVREATAAALETAKKRWSVPMVTVARRIPASVPVGAELVVVAKPEMAESIGALPDGSFVIALGDASREPISAALVNARAELAWTIAAFGSPRGAVPWAWARVVEATLEAQ